MRVSSKKPIIITPGEPLGIGPDIVIKSLESFNYPYQIIADPDLLLERAELLKIKLNAKKLLKNSLMVSEKTKKRYVLDSLDAAVELCMNKKAAAMLTGPVHKAMLNQAGYQFTGHTQYLAKKAQVNINHVVMFFESFLFKLGLVTDHLPLSKVSESITPKRLTTVIKIIYQSLQNLYRLSSPRIAVCGLNPHAGESGYLGSEENDIIQPVIQSFQRKGMMIEGPLSADSVFNRSSLKKYDVIIGMYHDQGLSVLKHSAFGKSVNITLGLPFLRTSVDHGTACELAGTGKADPSNMIYAFRRTVQLC